MFKVFEADTADTVWRSMAEAVRNEGVAQASRAGPTLELMRAATTIRDPRQRWIVSRHPPINIAFALAELVWVYTGRNDSAFLNFFNSRLPSFAGSGPVYHGAYGHRLRKAIGMDQLDRAYQALRNKPDTRQVVLQIWHGALDMPSETGMEAAADIPCNALAFLKVRNGALEWTQIVRSNDLMLGFPYNVVVFTFLQEMMAGWLGLGLGSYNHLADSLHVYTEAMQGIRESPDVPRQRSDESVCVPKEVCDRSIGYIADALDMVVAGKMGPSGFGRVIADAQRLPEAFRNMLRVLLAESARRLGAPTEQRKIVRDCSNPVFVALWEAWLRRHEKGGRSNATGS